MGDLWVYVSFMHQNLIFLFSDSLISSLVNLSKNFPSKLIKPKIFKMNRKIFFIVWNGRGWLKLFLAKSAVY